MATILVADDDRNIVLALTARLIADGHEVLTACDGVSAIKCACEAKPDAILLDVSMPAGTGTHVTQVLKADPETMGIPILMMTAKEDPKHFNDAMVGGACAFLSKPFADNALKTMLDAALQDRTWQAEGLALWEISSAAVN